jgi:hypothetical protein
VTLLHSTEQRNEGDVLMGTTRSTGAARRLSGVGTRDPRVVRSGQPSPHRRTSPRDPAPSESSLLPEPTNSVGLKPTATVENTHTHTPAPAQAPRNHAECVVAFTRLRRRAWNRRRAPGDQSEELASRVCSIGSAARLGRRLELQQVRKRRRRMRIRGAENLVRRWYLEHAGGREVDVHGEDAHVLGPRRHLCRRRRRNRRSWNRAREESN